MSSFLSSSAKRARGFANTASKQTEMATAKRRTHFCQHSLFYRMLALHRGRRLPKIRAPENTVLAGGILHGRPSVRLHRPRRPEEFFRKFAFDDHPTRDHCTSCLLQVVDGIGIPEKDDQLQTSLFQTIHERTVNHPHWSAPGCLRCANMFPLCI